MIEFIVALVGLAVVAKLMPSFILTARFSYPNAKFSAIPNTYIKEKELGRLLESKSIEDFKTNVVSRDFLLEGDTTEKVQTSVDASFEKLVLMAKSDSPARLHLFYEAYLEKTDADALKQVLADLFAGKSVAGTAASERMRRLIEKLRGANIEEARVLLRQHGFPIGSDLPLEHIEREIDRTVIRRLLEVPVPPSCRRARDRFVKTLIDITNIKAILRGKRLGLNRLDETMVPGGWELPDWKIADLLAAGSIPDIVSLLDGTSYIPYLRRAATDYEAEGIVAYERALDRALLSVANDIANDNPLALGPGIRFLVEKEFEARNLKIIAKAVPEGMQEDARKVVVT
jgi:vacuolar-type H+-ATPase subunit C/Vma6